MSKDLNDLAQEQQLPDDLGADAQKVSADVPRVLTVQEITHRSAMRAMVGLRQSGLTTGHHAIDEATGGLKPGFVWVFGADTSWGKSSFLVMVADENIRRGRRVLIVSAEDSEQIYGDRLLLRRSKVSANAMRSGNLTRDDRARLTKVVAEAEDAPVFLDARGRNVEWICKQVKLLVKEHSIDLVAYDYLQAFDNERHQQDRRNQVSYIARVLTDSAKTSGIAGLIFSQITVSEGKSHPDKHSIRESRDVSNAAEVVMLGFTPEKPIVSKQNGATLVEAGQRCVFLDKCKDGPRGGLYPMDWNAHSACFEAVPDPELNRFADLGDFAEAN